MAITLDGTTGITTPDVEPTSSTVPTNGVYLPAANTVGIATNGAERVRIDTNGQITGENSAGSTALGLTSTAAAANTRVRLTTTSNTSSVSYVLGNSHATYNKQAAMLLRSPDGGLDFYTGQTSGSEPTTGTVSFSTLPTLTGVMSPTTGLGYGTGAGGTVTQLTSKATAVTLNKPTGRITTAADALGAGTLVSFVFNNSLIATNDIVLLNLAAQAGNYEWKCGNIGAGTALVYIKNITGGPLSEALTFNFAIIKGSAS